MSNEGIREGEESANKDYHLGSNMNVARSYVREESGVTTILKS